MPFEQAERHLTGSPVTVRPMTRRWISEVPSKIVKIFGSLRAPLLSPVYAGKWAYSLAWLGLERPPTASNGPGLLPELLPAATARVVDPRGLTLAQRVGERCVYNNCRRRLWHEKILVGSLPDGSPVFACSDHEEGDR